MKLTIIPALLLILVFIPVEGVPPSAPVLKEPEIILPIRSFAPPNADELCRLAELYGRNKDLPPGFEAQALLALAYYPELADERIRFVVRPALVPLTSYVNPFSLYGKSRTYIITISSGLLRAMEPLVLANHSFNAQIGILGHELAHIVDYRRRGNGEMLRIPFCSMRRGCRVAFERATDIRTIRRGLGWQLTAWADEVEAAFAETRGEDGPGSDAYLSGDEIRRLITEIPLYSR